jgi:hypothetical protein
MIENDKYAKIYKGKGYLKPNNKKVPKVIAFDLDETLGSFMDLEELWNILISINANNLNQYFFNKLLDLYPEFVRYGIIPILEYLYQKKLSGECSHIYIYTNNQCSQLWTEMICNYFNYKLNIHENTPLFDRLILAFKINDIPVELSRTTHDKIHSDFIRCTLLPKSTQICFIDNSYFPNMKNERVYYIQPRSYHHNLSFDEIIQRITNTNLGIDIDISSSTNVLKYNSSNVIKKQSRNYDIFVAQKIMYHIKDFFYLTKRKIRTKKIKLNIGKFTRKKLT